jgi:hypothetical protein
MSPKKDTPKSAGNTTATNIWPTSFALKKLTTAEEKQIGALVRKAVS